FPGRLMPSPASARSFSRSLCGEGDVTNFLLFSFVGELCPALSSLTSLQTFMPERQQPHFHIDESGPPEQPVFYIVNLWRVHWRMILTMCQRPRIGARLI